MTARLEVLLHGDSIGELVDEGGSSAFQFYPRYWEDPHRVVLGQWFEDGRPDEVYRGPGSVPAFFANLEPEGSLATWLARKNGLGSEVLAMLGVVGSDLPGAVELRRLDGPDPPVRTVFQPPPPTPSFSLAGVQLKLPMSLDRHDRLTLPLPGELSGWLAKFPSEGRYSGIVANEAATMHWARVAGFPVADCRIHAPPQLDAGLGIDLENVEEVLLVRRFDRVDGRRVHQEDLAQCLWLDPDQKYPGDSRRFDAASERRRRGATTVEGIARYAARLLGPSGFDAYLQRFVFVVASGNGDAHLKNLSLVYPDGRRPTWAPLYDQVSTVAWQEEELACPLYGVRNFPALRMDLVERMAREAGADPARARAVVEETARRCLAAWGSATAEVAYPEDHRRRLVRHWSRVPLLREFGGLGA